MNTTTPGTALVPYQAPRARRPWGRWLLGLMLLSLLLVGVALYAGFDELRGMPVSVVIDGEEVGHDLDLGALPAGHKLTLVACVLVALVITAVVLAVVLPLTLVVVAAIILLVLLAVIGAPLLAVLLVLAVVASPLLAIGLLAWWALRPARPRSAP